MNDTLYGPGDNNYGRDEARDVIGSRVDAAVKPLFEELDRLRAQLSAATERAEKAEGLVRQYEAVESSWDAQAVAKELGLPLASDIRAEILPAVVKLKQERDGAFAELALARGEKNVAEGCRRVVERQRDEVRAQLCAAREALEEWLSLAEYDRLSTASHRQRTKYLLTDPAPPCPHAAALATEERRVLALAIQVAATNPQAVVETLSVEGIIAKHDSRIRSEERTKTLEETQGVIQSEPILDGDPPLEVAELINRCRRFPDTTEKMIRSFCWTLKGILVERIKAMSGEPDNDNRPDGGEEVSS